MASPADGTSVSYTVTEATIKLLAYLKTKPGVDTEFIDNIAWNVYYHILSQDDRIRYIKEHIPFLSDNEIHKIRMYLDYIIDTTSLTKSYETKARELGSKLLSLIYKLAKDHDFELNATITSFIDGMLKSDWKDAYANTMIYRVIPEHLRSYHIRQQLPFMTPEEAEHVTRCLNYICSYASCC